MSIKNLVFLAGTLMALSACQPRIDSRGNIILMDEMKNFVVGKTTMSDVIQKCGTPSLHIDNFTWIYFSATAKEAAFSKVSLQNRLIVKMIFDDKRVLKSIQKIKQPRKAILMDKAITNLTQKNK